MKLAAVGIITFLVVLGIILTLIFAKPYGGDDPTPPINVGVELKQVTSSVCSDCAVQPGYQLLDGTTMLGATEMPTTNAVANKIYAKPSEILSKCMQGGQIDPDTLVPTVGCNQSSRCVGIAYDTESSVCTLLGGYTDPSETSPSTTVSTYLKNCSCSSGSDASNFVASVSCGSNVYGSQQCPTGTCYGDQDNMTSYCCMDGNEPAGCTVTSAGLTSGIFVPYMFNGETKDNFSDTSGCVVAGNCPVISFSPVGSYNVNVYVNTYTAYSSRLQDPSVDKANRKVAECRLENISCQNDCVTEVAYIVGFPDTLPTETTTGQTYCYKAPDPGTDFVTRTPDTILLMKGRLMSSQTTTNEGTGACAPLFSQDVILARLMTNSNKTDWITLFNRDTVLQTFLNDRRFPPTTKFYWHPGTVDATGTPMGIETSDGKYSTVWVDPATLNTDETFCAANSSYIFSANEAVVARAPACTVPFIAGCRVYTNPGGYFIPGGAQSSLPTNCTGGTWLLSQAKDGINYVVAPTVYDTATLDPVSCSTYFQINTMDASNYYCADAKNPALLDSPSTPGLCGTNCSMAMCDDANCESTDASAALKSGLCSDLDSQAGDSACALALKSVIGDSQYYNYTQTWCMRDDTNALGLDPAPPNPCFVNDVRRVMSGNAANSTLYGLQYGGSAACDALS